MIHRIVCCRQIDECCTGNHTSLVTIFDMLSQVKQLCCSSSGVILFNIIRSYNLYVWHKMDIGL